MDLPITHKNVIFDKSGIEAARAYDPKKEIHKAPFVPMPDQLLYAQGERIYVNAPQGLTHAQALEVLRRLPSMIAQLEMAPQERLAYAIGEAEAKGNKPLFEMLVASFKELYPGMVLPGRSAE